jgi:undecaprenyl-diphosphatase
MGAVSGGTLLFVGLKALFGRTRPTVVPMLVVEGAPSFPSGHATMSAIVYLSVAVIVARYESRAALRAYVLLAGLLVTGLVGATRVVLGVHYPSDVLAGWALGLAWAAVWWLVAIWVERRRRDRPS